MPVVFSQWYCCFPNSVYEVLWFFGFLRDCRVILLSVCIVISRGTLSAMCSSFMVSIALTIGSCSSWLFEHLLWNVSLFWSTSSFCMNMAIPAPNPWRCCCHLWIFEWHCLHGVRWFWLCLQGVASLLVVHRSRCSEASLLCVCRGFFHSYSFWWFEIVVPFLLVWCRLASGR